MNPPAQQTLTHLSCQTLTHHPVSTLTFSCPPVTDHTNLNTDIVFSINEHLWTLSSDYNDLHPYINVLLLYICICVCIFICICIWKCNGYVCAHAFMQTCANVLCIFIYRYRHRYTFRNIYNMHMDKNRLVISLFEKMVCLSKEWCCLQHPRAWPAIYTAFKRNHYIMIWYSQ